ncbi:MAG: hypothetical protein ABSF60_00405 [Verrucomicrobiota bacterium]
MKNLLIQIHCDIENGRQVGQLIRASPATDDTEISLNYRRPDTITFFAKEAPFVASWRARTVKRRKRPEKHLTRIARIRTN